jgi:predicted amidohydrolase
MIKNLSIAIVQANLLWEDIEGNIHNFTQKLNSIKDNPHIVILPEMFTTGFSMNPETLAEPEIGRTTKWMLKMAQLKGFAICGSFIIKEDEKYFNRFHFVTPNGSIYKYDKRHLFTFANENIKYTCGSNRLVIEYLGWRILPQICYDVRFPVWSRNKNDYDLIINVANFPGNRREIWSTLLRARAIENQCYVAAANRIGEDELKIYYTGDSQMINAIGQPIAEGLKGEEKIIYGTFNIDELQMFRKKFPVLLDADDFTLN